MSGTDVVYLEKPKPVDIDNEVNLADLLKKSLLEPAKPAQPEKKIPNSVKAAQPERKIPDPFHYHKDTLPFEVDGVMLSGIEVHDAANCTPVTELVHPSPTPNTTRSPSPVISSVESSPRASAPKEGAIPLGGSSYEALPDGGTKEEKIELPAPTPSQGKEGLSQTSKRVIDPAFLVLLTGFSSSEGRSTSTLNGDSIRQFEKLDSATREKSLKAAADFIALYHQVSQKKNTASMNLTLLKSLIGDIIKVLDDGWQPVSTDQGKQMSSPQWIKYLQAFNELLQHRECSVLRALVRAGEGQLGWSAYQIKMTDSTAKNMYQIVKSYSEALKEYEKIQTNGLSFAPGV